MHHRGQPDPWHLADPRPVRAGLRDTGHVVALSNDLAVGLLLIVCSAGTLTVPTTPMGVVAFEAACGLWLIAAPFAFHERAMVHAMTNEIVVGACVLLASLSDAWIAAGRRHHTA